MKSFPNHFTPEVIDESKEVKQDLLFRRTLSYLRKEIYEHVLTNEKNDYYDIEAFMRRKFDRYDKKETESYLEVIRDELHALGWKTGTSYGDTALFIYSGEKPESCW